MLSLQGTWSPLQHLSSLWRYFTYFLYRLCILLKLVPPQVVSPWRLVVSQFELSSNVETRNQGFIFIFIIGCLKAKSKGMLSHDLIHTGKYKNCPTTKWLRNLLTRSTQWSLIDLSSIDSMVDSSMRTVHSIRKLAITWAFIAKRGWLSRLNSLSSIAHFTILPKALGFYKICLSGWSIRMVTS